MAQPVNFQPQVPDTSNGPHIHTYIPRADGSIMIGGVAYIPQNAGVAAAAISVSAAALPVAVQPAVVQPTVVQPAAVPIVTPVGGPSQIQMTPQHLYHPYSLPYVAPAFAPQPYMSYPIVAAHVPCMTPPQPVAAPAYGYNYAAPQQYMYAPGQQPMGGSLATYHMQQPAFGTIGLTPNDVMMQQLATAQNLEMSKPQEMKPADEDKFRMYWVRELDGTWTQRNRLTIDSGDIGTVRWYALDGSFYGVRLPD